MVRGRARHARKVLSKRFAQVAPAGMRALVVSDPTPGDVPWIDRLIEQRLTPDMPRCPHLQQGEGFLHAHEGFGRCARCHLGHVAALAVAGVWGAGCAGCGTGSRAWRPVAIEAGRWTLITTVCELCAAGLVAVGQRASVVSSGAVR